jgi:Domain of unknown function (DUF4412)
MRFSSGCISAAVAIIGAAMPLSAQSFEGRISFKVADQHGASQEMVYQVRDNKVRFEMPGAGGLSGAMILDPANQKMIMMMPSQKMYMERAFVAPAAASGSAKAAANAKVTATGKKETVAGYQCEHFLVTDSDGASIDACIAHGLGSFMAPPAGNPMTGGASNANDWRSKLGKDGFPLKVTKGNTTVLEVTKIEKMSLDPSLFTPPDGWKKFDMPNMPGMRQPPR